MGDRSGRPMSISADSPSDETLNRGPWRCSCGDSMNNPLGLNEYKTLKVGHVLVYILGLRISTLLVRSQGKRP